ARSPRAVLRGHRLGGRRPPSGRAQRRHTHVLGPGRVLVSRHGWRHHVGLDRRRRMGGDRAQGPSPAGRGWWLYRDAVTIVWLNGDLVADTEASVSPFDHGLLVGDGVFESLRLYRGRPFAVRRHLDRLERSAHGIDFALPARAALEAAVAGVVAANPDLTEARLRITVTSGRGPLGSARGDAGSTVL